MFYKVTALLVETHRWHCILYNWNTKTSCLTATILSDCTVNKYIVMVQFSRTSNGYFSQHRKARKVTIYHQDKFGSKLRDQRQLPKWAQIRKCTEAPLQSGPRTSYYACLLWKFWPVNCIFWSIRTLNCCPSNVFVPSWYPGSFWILWL